MIAGIEETKSQDKCGRSVLPHSVAGVAIMRPELAATVGHIA